jgi:hypothetical protein
MWADERVAFEPTSYGSRIGDGKGDGVTAKTGKRYQTLGHPSTTIPTVALVDSTIDSKVASLLCVGALFNLPNYLIAYCHSPLKTNKKKASTGVLYVLRDTISWICLSQLKTRNRNHVSLFMCASGRTIASY